MPNYDKTGPLGYGSQTGRGMGPCGGGMSRRTGRGRGLGWRRFWGYYPASTLSKKEEAEILSEEVGILEEDLKAMKVRQAELKGQK
ncbi:DUF5320 domain-containing protein [Patescibacteria group bacterium]|nr:DUF5320 domain-containing protein [Patescibacteria group bacterium]